MGSSISINGVRLDMRGDGSIFVNGKQYGPIDGTPVAAVDSGNKSLTLDTNGRLVGDIHGDLEVTKSLLFGSVTLVIEGSVGGSVRSDGDVQCKSVGGSVTAGRDVQAGSVGGSVTAGRDATRFR